MTFSVDVSQTAQGIHLVVSGDVTHHTSPQLREILQQQFRQDARYICVDLAGQRVDASGAATLLEGVAWARQSGGRFQLCHLGKATRDMLQLYRLEHVFDIADDQQEAAA